MTIRCSMLCALTLAFALAAAPAHSALDRDTITRWIAAAQDLQAWAEEQDEDFDDELLDGDAMPTFADIENVYRVIYDRDADVRRTLRGHGFNSAEEWGNVSARITMGMMSIEIGDRQPQMDAEMQRAIEELENNPDVPPQMREMLLQQIQQAMGAMSGLTEGVREEDLPALREMRSELQAVIDIDGEGDW